MSALTEAVEAFHKWEQEKYGDKTPLADIHVDLWVEAYMMGYANATKRRLHDALEQGRVK